MRIHSKFKDYYDTALGYGIDPNVHWVRETVKLDSLDVCSTIKMPRRYHFSQPNFKKFERIHGEESVQPVVFLFCGQLYPCMWIAVRPYESETPMVNILCRTMEKFEECLNEWESDIFGRYGDWNRRTMYNRTKEYFNQHVSEDRIRGIHFETKSPVLVMTQDSRAKREVTINPMLKPFGFQSIVDPFTAFQEISMYVSGVLGSTGVDMIQVSDEDMKYKKGFHDMSFKNRGKKCPR